MAEVSDNFDETWAESVGVCFVDCFEFDVEGLVHHRWTADPDLLDGLSVVAFELLVDPGVVPAAAFAFVGDPDLKFEVVCVVLLAVRLEGCQHIKSDCFLTVPKRHVDFEFEALLDPSRLLVTQEVVQAEVEVAHLRNQVHEGEDTGAACEDDVIALALHVQRLAHRTLDEEFVVIPLVVEEPHRAAVRLLVVLYTKPDVILVASREKSIKVGE